MHVAGRAASWSEIPPATAPVKSGRMGRVSRVGAEAETQRRSLKNKSGASHAPHSLAQSVVSGE
jgi:hypothetical protein